MLIRFAVENFRSISERQELSLVASPDESLPGNLISIEAISPLRLLRSAAIYGANASGKTNILQAISFARWLVTYSQTRLESRDTPIRVSPFTFDPNWTGRPSRFEFEFVANGVRTTYSFSTDRQQIIEEALVTYPEGRPRMLFTRKQHETNRPDIEFGQSLKGTKEKQALTMEATRKNSLVLSAASQADFSQLQPFYDWFTKDLTVVFPEERHLNVRALAERFNSNVELKSKILLFLAIADVGVVDISSETTELPADMIEHFRKEFQPEAFERFIKSLSKQTELALVHKAGAGRTTRLDLDDESRGTRNLLALVDPIIRRLEGGGVLFIDEFTASLHPHVARRIIELIHSQQSARPGPQLIFASHDATLLDSDLFRRDQIWFTEKDENGATHLYPLSDFHPRKGENLARGYLQGRYGAIPIPGLVGFEDGATQHPTVGSSGQSDTGSVPS